MPYCNHDYDEAWKDYPCPACYEAEIERLRALVRAAYFEGALAGWHLSTPNDADIEPWWDESDALRTLRGEGE